VTEPSIYATLVDRVYAMPPHLRHTRPLAVTWSEFREVFVHSMKREPTPDDLVDARILGLPIEIVDEFGLRVDRPAPVVHDGKVTLSLLGGPADGKTVTVPVRVGFVCIPSLLPMGRVVDPERDVRFMTHRYNARTGIYVDGRMPSDRITISGSFTWFGRRVERLVRWLDKRFAGDTTEVDA
jgi:hypothetical protein